MGNVQKLGYAGPWEAIQARMKEIVREAGLADDGLTPGRGKLANRSQDRPSLGRRLVRVWRGDRRS